MKFPESYLAEFKHFSVLGFHLSGGAPNWDSKMPDPAPGVESLYAVGKVKLVRLSD
jgi:hypothetical protein